VRAQQARRVLVYEADLVIYQTVGEPNHTHFSFGDIRDERRGLLGPHHPQFVRGHPTNAGLMTGTEYKVNINTIMIVARRS